MTTCCVKHHQSWSNLDLNLSNCCQARVQVPNPLSQQAPNPDSKVRPSLKTQKPNSLDWADTIITWPPPTTPKFLPERVLRQKSINSKGSLRMIPEKVIKNVQLL